MPNGCDPSRGEVDGPAMRYKLGMVSRRVQWRRFVWLGSGRFVVQMQTDIPVRAHVFPTLRRRRMLGSVFVPLALRDVLGTVPLRGTIDQCADAAHGPKKNGFFGNFRETRGKVQRRL